MGYERYSFTASYMATMFATGTRAWMLWMVLNTNPPPVPNTLIRSLTIERTSSGEPNGSTRWVSIPPPQKVIRSPYRSLSARGSMATAEVCTGFRMSKPASAMSSSRRQTEPHEWMNVFQAVCVWTQSLIRAWNGWKSVAIGFRCDHRSALGTEIRARDEYRRQGISDDVMDLRQIREAYVALALEDLLEVVGASSPGSYTTARDRGCRVDDATWGRARRQRHRNLCRRTPRAGRAGRTQPFDFGPNVLEGVDVDGPELLQVVGRIEISVLEWFLARDRVEIEPCGGHARAGWCRAVSLRIHEQIPIWFGFSGELAGDEHRRAVECRPRFPVLVAKAVDVGRQSDSDGVDA